MTRAGTGSSGSTVYPPFAAPPAGGRGTLTVREGAADPPAEDDYPAIEQFLDELPSINDYLADSDDSNRETGLPIATGSHANRAPARDLDDEGWAISEWQSYDWGKLSTLGRTSREGAQADASWMSTDWADRSREDMSASGSGSSRAGNAPGVSNAAEVAAALDDIARRIRSGELSIDHVRGTPPEAAMAAALAALLRMRG